MIDTVTGTDVRDTLGLAPHPADERALRLAGSALRAVNTVTRIPAVRRLADARGQQLLDYVVTRGLDGIGASYRGTAVAGQPTDQ